MIGSTRTLRVWAYPAPADLRKGFDGLSGLVTQRHQDPLAGDCFLFVNRVRTRATISGRIALDMYREAQGPSREQTMKALHHTRRR